MTLGRTQPLYPNVVWEGRRVQSVKWLSYGRDNWVPGFDSGRARDLSLQLKVHVGSGVQSTQPLYPPM
jgi:hypothetical protein